MCSHLSNVFDNIFEVGETYLIQNFAVQAYQTKYKCVPGEAKIIFIDMTEANKVEHPEKLLLPEFFNFTPLAHISGTHFQDNHCIGTNNFTLYYHPQIETNDLKFIQIL